MFFDIFHLCHLVPSIRLILATVMVIRLYKPRSSAASLSSTRSISDIVCISSIHLFLGRTSHPYPSLSAVEHHFLFKTVCSLHIAKKQHLLFAALCLTDVKSSVWALTQAQSVVVACMG